ncbi:MAG: outer membrane lipoprotein-sorting protein [Betaproteobacteria bacterium]|nr:outer membrane lipoprotein-sorting protein [Betaproteobacteria bacterium]
MKPLRRIALLGFAAAVMVSIPARAADPSADEIVKRSLEAFYYAGSDMRAKVQMKLINPQGQIRQRDMTMLRLNPGKSGDQRYYIYFHGPADVKGTSFLVWKYPAKDSDRWIFIPTLRLVKRIAADDKRSSFVGSDFTYEDVSGRNLEDETHALARKEDLGGRPTYVIESKPKVVVDYSRRLSWIDRERWLPLKEEYFDARNEPQRTFVADKVEQKGKYWTVTARSMKNLQSAHRTEVVFQEVEYDVGLKQDIFTERYLRDAPSQWIR